MADYLITEEPAKDLHCFFSTEEKADGIPYQYNMHKIAGIAGGVGPTGSIRSRSVSIPIPRSRKATDIHRFAVIVKLFFLVAGILILAFTIRAEMPYYLKILFPLLAVISGGIIVSLLYKLTRVKSKCLHSSNFLLVKKYRAKGFRRGFHPMISTTPVGLIVFIFRWLL